YQLLDQFRVQVQALARFNRHFFLAFAWHNVAPWPSVYASHTKDRIGSADRLLLAEPEDTSPLRIAPQQKKPDKSRANS
ncbi:hypothetical protein U0E23_31125, partial [Burkholderia stagnalis]|uniref:hypothetical protein n=1 Tax=Burkholderia stagnalis TaxID=1503054 RepID=UPI002AB5BF3E